MSDAIRFSCNDCGAQIKARSDKVGQSFTCPKCGATLWVPNPNKLDDDRRHAFAAATPQREKKSRSLLWWVGSGFVFLIFGCCFLSFVGAIIDPPNINAPMRNVGMQALPAASEKPVAPLVASWVGSGSKNTETFQVESSEWSVEWSLTPTTSPGLLQIYVHDADNDALIELVGNAVVDKQTSDVSVIRGSGRYYLKANGVNGDWKMSVYDGVR